MINRKLMKHTKITALMMLVAGSVALTGCGDSQTAGEDSNTTQNIVVSDEIESSVTAPTLSAVTENNENIRNSEDDRDNSDIISSEATDNTGSEDKRPSEDKDETPGDFVNDETATDTSAEDTPSANVPDAPVADKPAETKPEKDTSVETQLETERKKIKKTKTLIYHGPDEWIGHLVEGAVVYRQVIEYEVWADTGESVKPVTVGAPEDECDYVWVRNGDRSIWPKCMLYWEYEDGTQVWSDIDVTKYEGDEVHVFGQDWL